DANSPQKWVPQVSILRPGIPPTSTFRLLQLPTPRQFPAAPRCRPVGFDLDGSRHPRRVMQEARPRPVLRLRAQPPNHRVAMHIPELLDTFLLAVNVEVIV